MSALIFDKGYGMKLLFLTLFAVNQCFACEKCIEKINEELLNIESCKNNLDSGSSFDVFIYYYLIGKQEGLTISREIIAKFHEN